MAKTKAQKAELLQSYKDMLSQSSGFLAVDADRLNNVQTVFVRKELSHSGATFTVVKNTIFKIALQDANVSPEALTFEGSTAIITYQDDPTVPAKIIKEMFDKESVLEPKFGYVDGEFIDKDKVTYLASIPSREVLLAQLLGSISSPITGFMNAVTGNVKGFVRVLSQISENAEA